MKFELALKRIVPQQPCRSAEEGCCPSSHTRLTVGLNAHSFTRLIPPFSGKALDSRSNCKQAQHAKDVRGTALLRSLVANITAEFYSELPGSMPVLHCVVTFISALDSKSCSPSADTLEVLGCVSEWIVPFMGSGRSEQ